MPYICLARTDIPNGTLQVLDLVPNVSLRSDLDPPGQTRYLRRVEGTLVEGTGAGGLTRKDVDGLTAYLVDRVEPFGGTWTTASQIAVRDGILARLDAGQALTLADVNAVIQVTFAGSDLDGNVSNSTGTVQELLEVLAGRGYRLPAGSQKLTGAAWNAAQQGSFTRTNTVFDTQMVGGVIGPVNPWIRHPGLAETKGGDTVQVEVQPARETVDEGSFQQSLLNGHLSKLQDGSVTLFPDSDLQPFQATWYQPGPHNAAVTPARIVTVYNNDGTLA